MTVGERIKMIRMERNFSQKQFGEVLGVSRDVINNYENGRGEPTELFLNHLCNLYEINPEWLKDGEGERTLGTERDAFVLLRNEYNLNYLDIAIIKSYLELSEEGKKYVRSYLFNLFSNLKQYSDEEIKCAKE